ncbi:hypothetical protein X769_30020 [Mesorhizobium sp. LSJC268A00]|nr:hypothetical protein X773_06800 [Mesorhizobium sp. LSJC285A00]ESW95181.1 hypothetical protein X769_30020 [Mesorhizobium sp. LSJC268A00]ESX07490.1 hypothetical protein X768_26980 [Mesorhizobium sp. LSJC265A00]ESX95424.1 hypothetical protein X754_10285 [Mesorhizobium sp. LNJC403B00]ESY18294.1 hypothetical protein X751_19045 [Mesorhizobium sp. LNJC395A00]ESY50902.1 hypothetical protein X745_25810 [Mesorhizobium sp. LNJC374B00]ESY53623.1 hypothetical protein X744_26700 [Mesorhizobium sp. LNJC3
MAAIMFVFARFLLMPFVLIAVTLFAMALHISGTALHHQFAWHQTVATVTDVSSYSEAQGNGLTAKGINVAVTYVANDAPMTWSGKGKDIGLYTASKGDAVKLYYNPANPSILDTAAMKGWRGGLLLLAATGGFTVFYVWFFWLRGRTAPPASPMMPSAVRVAGASAKPPQQQRGTFGRR